MAPMSRDLRAVVIGAGMAGILAAIRLRETGIDDVTVYEKANRVGGTWRENTYPGIACDVPSHLYSYSFAPNPDFSHTFSPGDEIEAYFERVAQEHGVDQLICFGEEVTRAAFVDGRWELETSRGRQDHADIVIAATGVLHHPRVADIPGLDSFTGATFHSARWNHEVPLDGRRVGVIGTGSSAIQITSALVDRVERFCLFQRTAQWVIQAPNPEYSEDDRRRFHDEPESVTALRDALSASFSMFANSVVDAQSPELAAIAAACEQNLEEHVKDPGLRERLRPTYQAGCKRLIMSPDFYEAIQKPNAALVTEAIERIEPEGVRTVDGTLHELDVLVLATGFQVDRFLRPIDVIGREGMSLDDVWAKRPTAYLSISIPEFPNLFMLNGPNGPVGNFSLIEVAELQVDYVLQLIDRIRSGACREISPSQEATDAHEAERVEQAQNTVWMTGCRSWYLDDRGVPAVWPWTFDHFREVMAEPDLGAYVEV